VSLKQILGVGDVVIEEKLLETFFSHQSLFLLIKKIVSFKVALRIFY